MFSPSDDSPCTSPANGDTSINKNISNILSLLETPTAAKRLSGSETDGLTGTPDVKLLNLLKGVTAYVEVRSHFENRSKAITHQLVQLGASVVPKFTNEVTHVVFKDGKKSTKDKARKKNIHLVSVSWIEACKKNQMKMPEKDYPANIRDDAAVPLAVSRLKKSKSMQPKDFEEELASSAEKVERRRKMREKKEKFKTLENQHTPLQFNRHMILVAETQPMSPVFLSPGITVPETPPSMRRKLEQLRKKKALLDRGSIEGDVSGNISDSIQESPEADESLSPLQKRLFAASSTSGSPSCSTTSSSMGVAPLTVDNIALVKGSVLKHPPENPIPEEDASNQSPQVDTSRDGVRTKRRSSLFSGKVDNKTKPEKTKAKRTSPESASAKAKGKRKLMSLDEPPIEKLVSPAASTSRVSGGKHTGPSFPAPKSGAAAKKAAVTSSTKGKKRKSDELDLSGSENDSNEQKKKPRSKSETTVQSNAVEKGRGKRRSMAVAPVQPTRTSRRRSCMPAISTPTSQSKASGLGMVEEQSQGCTDAPDIDTPEKPAFTKPAPKVPKSCVTQKGESVSLRRSSRRSSIMGSLRPISESMPLNDTDYPRRSQSIGLENVEDQPSMAGSSYMSMAYSTLGAPDSSVLGYSRRRSTHEFVLAKNQKLKKKTVSMSSALDTSSSDEDKQKSKRVSKVATHVRKTKKTGKKSTSRFSESGSDLSCCSNSGKEERTSKKEEPTKSLVMTSLHFREQDTVRAVTRKLGGYCVEDVVSPRTSHVVCGNNRRTLNILLAISQGCWLVSVEWVYKSLEAGRWLEEEQFELHDMFPAAQLSRRERMTVPEVYKSSLFSHQGLIYVAEHTAPPHHDLVKLLKLCGGQVTHCARKAKVCVGSQKKYVGISVSEKWVLDSITSHKDLPFDEYKL